MNIDRSPTAEYIYSQRPEFEVKSAGVSPYAQKPISAELVEWSDIILGMQDSHVAFIKKNFNEFITDKIVDSLDVYDAYDFMDPPLVEILTKKIDGWLHAHLL
jgi:predicted protein tyrosine phosphatase